MNLRNRIRNLERLSGLVEDNSPFVVIDAWDNPCPEDELERLRIEARKHGSRVIFCIPKNPTVDPSGVEPEPVDKKSRKTN